jgi:hypothetical protein
MQPGYRREYEIPGCPCALHFRQAEVKLAAERVSYATTEAEKQKAQRWVEASDAVAGARPLRRS